MELSRRKFLETAASATAASAFPLFLSKYPQAKLIVGTGEHTYEVHHDWVQPPKNVKWGDTHGLALDSHGRFYVAHTVHPTSVGSDAICVYDQEGNLVNSWGAEFRGGAHGLDLRNENGQEFLYHCDINRRLVVKTTLEGEIVWQTSMPTEPGVYKDVKQWCPTNVAFAPDGDIFVGDGYGSSYVHRYTKHGEYRQLVCGPGSGTGQVSCPHGLWVDDRDGDPKLAIADRANRRIQYMTFEGQFISFLKTGMRMPCHIHFNRQGEMLVPDLQSVVTILDKNNEVIVQLCDGDPSNLRDAPRNQFIPGRFIHPHAAIWINARDIVVVEWVPIGRVTLLRKVDA